METWQQPQAESAPLLRRPSEDNADAPFLSLVFPGVAPALVEPEDSTFAQDLNLDQVLRDLVKGREEASLLRSLFYHGLRDPDSVYYRHEVFRDLEDSRLLAALQGFAASMRQVRLQLEQSEKMEVHYQRAGWRLDAARRYCQALVELHQTLRESPVRARGLMAFRRFLDEYVPSREFGALDLESRDCQTALRGIRYCVRIRGLRVDVTPYADEGDYSADVLATFERFKQGAAKDYLILYRTWPGMNHVGARILELVADLFRQPFADLDAFTSRHADFFDATVRTFERDLQFYLAYVDYIAPVRAAQLTFCCPEVSSDTKAIFAANTFDLALARKLAPDHVPVVCNDFRMDGAERIIVVTGPNQGGKTTFARAFGQVHHLARIGVPVPGTAARLFLGDQILTHFEREEDLSRLRGQLEDDVVRVQEILQLATENTVVVMNETFQSTTLRDALFLGHKVLERAVALDVLAVYVTFIDELARFGPSVVSMVSTVEPTNPAARTFKVVRMPADGLAYALAIADKYGLTYEALRRRIAP